MSALIITTFLAALLTALATGLGALPFAFVKKMSRRWQSLVILTAMTIHSFPEGAAIGVGYGTGELELGALVALVIAVHNIPEGIAISLPLRSKGVSIARCAWYSVFSSLPQPIVAVPAVVAVSFFQALLPVGLGFAAGAMIFLVIEELIPQSLLEAGCTPAETAWSILIGTALMLVLTGSL